MLSKDQTQDVGENATAVQAGNNATVQVIHNHGLSYSEVRQVALDVFAANFYELVGAAKETARVRAQEITEEFLKKLQEENPEGFRKAEEPDFQHGLLTIQKEYARTGDKELGDLLVDLLVDRSKQNERNLTQIVLNESLSVAPKLTSSQLAILALVFRLRYTSNFKVCNHDSLANYFDEDILPFVDNLTVNNSAYQHLEFAGCGSVQMGEISLEQVLMHNYKGLFFRGFTEEDVQGRGISIGLDKRFFVPCLNDQNKYQLNAINQAVLEQNLNTSNISEEDKKKIISLFNYQVMSDKEVRELCIKLKPYMEKIFEIWSISKMKSLSLTSVGITIGHANIKRVRGEFTDLSVWIK